MAEREAATGKLRVAWPAEVKHPVPRIQMRHQKPFRGEAREHLPSTGIIAQLAERIVLEHPPARTLEEQLKRDQHAEGRGGSLARQAAKGGEIRRKQQRERGQQVAEIVHRPEGEKDDGKRDERRRARSAPDEGERQESDQPQEREAGRTRLALEESSRIESERPRLAQGKAAVVAKIAEVLRRKVRRAEKRVEQREHRIARQPGGIGVARAAAKHQEQQGLERLAPGDMAAQPRHQPKPEHRHRDHVACLETQQKSAEDGEHREGVARAQAIGRANEDAGSGQERRHRGKLGLHPTGEEGEKRLTRPKRDRPPRQSRTSAQAANQYGEKPGPEEKPEEIQAAARLGLCEELRDALEHIRRPGRERPDLTGRIHAVVAELGKPMRQAEVIGEIIVLHRGQPAAHARREQGQHRRCRSAGRLRHLPAKAGEQPPERIGKHPARAPDQKSEQGQVEGAQVQAYRQKPAAQSGEQHEADQEGERGIASTGLPTQAQGERA